VSYAVLITRRAQRELADLPREAYARVKSAIGALAVNPRPPGCMKLTGVEAWRIREGDYRVLYEIDDPQRTVTVVQVGNRRDVYRN
jgi:mRNA interferase RelE/StbE